MKIFVFLSMIFLHIYDDFHLQTSWLANGKQKEWWEKVAPDKQYQYDYLAALLIHSISWSFCIMLPIAVYQRLELDWLFVALFITNAIIHSLIDNEKANRKKINLIEDQLFHLLQISCTALVMLCGR